MGREEEEGRKDCFTASHPHPGKKGRSACYLTDKALCVILDRARSLASIAAAASGRIVNSKPEWRSLTYLVAVSSSSSSFVTIHAQWANPPWLTRLTLRLPAPARVRPVLLRSLVAPQTQSPFLG